jgi:tetratricopeptide (TPR) repeat protein
VIQRLKSTNGLVVRSLSDTRRYAEIDQDPRSAGREQKVDYVVSSNYQIVNGRIKVTSQFLEVATGKVEAFVVETETDNLFSGENSVVNDISKKVLAKFASSVVEFHAKNGTDNQEAYALYVLAMNSSEERGTQQVLKSLEYLDRAVALDPNYATAWAAKAITHGDIVGHTNSGQHEHFQSSLEALTKALAIDPNLSEAYSASCHRKNRYEYDSIGAETACKHAVELDPNSPVAHRTYANFLYSRGRFEEAIIEIKKAIDIRPVSFRNQQMYGLTLYFAGRYDEAEQKFKQLIELNPNHNFLYSRLVKVYEQKEAYLEAFNYLVEMRTLQKAKKEEIDRLKAAYRTAGWDGVLIDQIKTAEAEVNRNYFQLGCLYAKTGDKDKAFDNLEKSYQERSHLIAMLNVDPELKSLHDDPRFADLIRRVEGK